MCRTSDRLQRDLTFPALAPAVRAQNRSPPIPVERGSGIGLSPGRYIAMAHNMIARERWVGCKECFDQRTKLVILRVGVRSVVRTLQLDGSVIGPRARRVDQTARTERLPHHAG
jgi:hypothetical protein